MSPALWRFQLLRALPKAQDELGAKGSQRHLEMSWSFQVDIEPKALQQKCWVELGGDCGWKCG